MGWLESDKEAIRKFLGYPLNQVALTQIQMRQDAIAGLSLDAVGTAQEYLRELKKIAQQINETRPYSAALSHSSATGSTDYMPGRRLGDLREEGRRYVALLADLLGLMVMGDFFRVAGAGNGRVVRS